MNTRRRGQTLLLFAISTLLIAVMVFMTLALGVKAKEKMELQSAADAAAYSNAVAIARTANAAAISNRVMIAHSVATLGSLGVLSWGTQYAHLLRHGEQVTDRWITIFSHGLRPLCRRRNGNINPLCWPCRIATRAAEDANDSFKRERRLAHARLNDDYNRLYLPELLPRWQASNQLFAERMDDLARAVSQPSSQRLLDSAALVNAPDLAVVAPPPLGELNRRETGVFVPDTDDYDVNLGHVGQMIMASRGHPFLFDRRDSTRHLNHSVTQAGGGGGHVNVNTNDQRHGRSYVIGAVEGEPGELMNFDSGAYQLIRPGTIMWTCPHLAAAAWAFARGIGSDVRETTVGPGPHQHSGHDLWPPKHADTTIPSFIDYDAARIRDQADLYGQPKHYVLLQRTNTSERDPWDLRFTFSFSESGASVDTVSGGSFSGVAGSARQVALGSSLVYYHRPDTVGALDNSPEPPNLFAPFWRATLASATVDRGNAVAGHVAADPARQSAFDGELTNVLTSAGLAEFAEAYIALRNSGFRGIH